MPNRLGKITVAGLGPGSPDLFLNPAIDAIREADVVIGYKYYFQFIESFLKKGTECMDTGMRQEVQRAEKAFELAETGKDVVVISSGDAGIYGMASLVFEMAEKTQSKVELKVIPGISAFQAAAAKLGAPLSHDLVILSLSDLLTSYALIEKRIKAAAMGDFVTAIYNPKSNKRYWQLYRLRELFLEEREETTPVAIVRQVARAEEQITLTNLRDFDPEMVDMFSLVIVGNSQSYISGDRFITPRGYYSKEEQEGRPGPLIMQESFRTIAAELKEMDLPLETKWILLHCIHTSADFELPEILKVQNNAAPKLNEYLQKGGVIITDVTMVQSGIRKKACERMGVEIKCYLHDPRTMELSVKHGITRTQAGIRLAVEEHPDALYVFGNAPTALIELTDLMRSKNIQPAGIIAAPVGFVNVKESKHRVKSFTDLPAVIIEGRKGGSTLAATIVNAILSLEDAYDLKPGRDV
ncbi:precorrin-3B C(17)-methyltransferase [Labilibaculum euxinus]|uniref:Precorrin-3B C(17)-methyltransferase n=1 Tax=Labilibaculum euxinus TaxID=2686357 RepID=A0A7M4D8D6_9BACT|nr:precorrin-3B C(17)-methyltransferase [Labilibaculum euxinus]MUP38915.1 precorrin-3B C(17)-methyltransferase [Labilibaculum euxinus]MVB08120.1 precorrin-3B C(17)-methyltransferase [Labilibaculum euxinus]